MRISLFHTTHPKLSIQNLTVSEIMEQLYRDKQKEEEDARIKGLSKEARQIYRKRIDNLKKIVKDYKVKLKGEADIALSNKVQSIANEEPNLYYKYKKERGMRLFHGM